MVSRYWIPLIVVVFCLVFMYFSDPPLEEKLRHVYLLSTRGSHYWKNRFKHPATLLHSYFFPSQDALIQNNNIEDVDNEEDMIKEKGGGEKVKEAVEKSLEKTKLTVEESAKSAAKIAGDTVHKTVDKVKDTLTTHPTTTSTHHHHPQDEL